MSRILLSIGVLLLLGAAPQAERSGWKLVWSDEFDVRVYEAKPSK